MILVLLPWLSFASHLHGISFSIPLVSGCVSLNLKRVSCVQHICRSCFCIHSATLCLLIGAFIPFTFKVCFFCFVLFCFLGPHLRLMEIPRLGVNLELQLPATATATATQDPSHVCNLYHSSQQCWILNPLSKARDGTHVLMDTSHVCYC